MNWALSLTLFLGTNIRRNAEQQEYAGYEQLLNMHDLPTLKG
jgi:hypothetical protein